MLWVGSGVKSWLRKGLTKLVVGFETGSGWGFWSLSSSITMRKSSTSTICSCEIMSSGSKKDFRKGRSATTCLTVQSSESKVKSTTLPTLVLDLVTILRPRRLKFKSRIFLMRRISPDSTKSSAESIIMPS